MKHLTFLIVLLAALGHSIVPAAEADEIVGYLIDSACGNRVVADLGKVQEHTVACALMGPCQESGYGLVVNREFLKFDEEGDKKALAFLEATDMKSHLKVKVSGSYVPWPAEFSASLDGLLMVDSIEAADK